jgi:cobalt/nickel transport system permease protein
MGAGHAHALYVHEHSAIHRMAPEAKLVAIVAFVTIVALTPRTAVWAFIAYGAMLAVVAVVSRISLRFIAARLLAILPFILFAFLIPFVASGERIDVFGVSVSEAGLWGAWNIVAKATIGATATILLAATTDVPDLLRGMSVLRVPPILISIAGFMIRYLELIAEELGRMRVAMKARGYEPRWLWQAKPMAAASGALFVRSYERGERIYAAMVARGYDGTMPPLDDRASAGWPTALLLPAVALVIATIALVVS